MRKVIFLLIVILSLPTNLWAADPIIGTWKLNIEKSEQPRYPMYQFKELTEIYMDIDSGMMEITQTGVRNNGGAVNRKYTWPKQGGVAEGTAEIVKGYELFVNPGEWYAIMSIGGKQIWYIHKIISKDGKTMYQTFKAVDPNGNPDEAKFVFEKQ